MITGGSKSLRLPLMNAYNIGGESKSLTHFIEKGSIQNTMFNYSITFFYENEKKLDALIENIKYCKDKVGPVIIIGLDGKKLHNLYLKDENKFESESYLIVKKYTTYKTYGSQIEITMKSPVTLVDKQIEYLVDFDEIFKKFGIEKPLYDSYYDIPPFANESSKKFLELERIVIF